MLLFCMRLSQYDWLQISLHSNACLCNLHEVSLQEPPASSSVRPCFTALSLTGSMFVSGEEMTEGSLLSFNSLVFFLVPTFNSECKYVKHIFELRMKDQIATA